MRTAGDVTPVAREIHREIAVVDPFIPISGVETLDSRLAKALTYPRFRAMVLAFFVLAQ